MHTMHSQRGHNYEGIELKLEPIAKCTLCMHERGCSYCMWKLSEMLIKPYNAWKVACTKGAGLHTGDQPGAWNVTYCIK